MLTLALSCLFSHFVAAPSAALEPILTITPEPGWVIFDPNVDGYAYRYGPSIMLNEDGTIDAWFASPGGPGSDGVPQWDWIRHKRSADGGRTWGEERVVLKATEGSRDRLSVCDPGVIRIGGTYYLGVTAVDNDPGNDNEVFVARSQRPEGPFEKWNGSGWGGVPQPIVVFREPKDVWGAGEPSFVVHGNTLFIYYTIISKTATGEPLNQTHVATAIANDPDWPATIQHHGLAFDRLPNEDSADVKFVDAAGRFVSLSTASRFSAESYIAQRESEDGLHWTAPVELRQNLIPWLHNCGLSGGPDGHLDINASNYLGYAYSKEGGVNWGFWHTQLHPVKVTIGR
jgi:hypothetical protein